MTTKLFRVLLALEVVTLFAVLSVPLWTPRVAVAQAPAPSPSGPLTIKEQTLTWKAGIVDANNGAPTGFIMRCDQASQASKTPRVYAWQTILPTTPLSVATKNVIPQPPAVAASAGTWYCAVYAANQFGESEPSNEVSFLFGNRPAAPTDLLVQ